MAQRTFLKERSGRFEVKTVAHTGETTHYCVCQPNCMSICPHTVTVRDGRIVQTTLAPLPDQRYNRICLRGLTSLQRIYDSRRIHYPMKRVGARGEGKWQRISWDEAITTITNKWKKNSEKYGTKANAIFMGTGRETAFQGGNQGVLRRLGNILDFTHVTIVVDFGITAGVKEVIGWNGPWPGNGPEDLVNSETVILLGYNITESQINSVHFYQDARDAGAKIIVIDPVFTHFAAQSDQFIPIRPGADPALLLGLIYCILHAGEEDAEFMRDHTVAPYLVRDDNGLFLRQSDLGADVEVADANDDEVVDVLSRAGETTSETNRPIVIDADGNTGTTDDIENPVMYGHYEINGIACTTAGELFRQRVEEYNPQRVEQLTGISPDVLQELAHRIATTKTTIRAGWGGQAYNNGHMVGKTLMCLAAVTGHIGLEGRDMGAFAVGYHGINAAWATPTGKAMTTIPSIVFPQVMREGKFRGKDYPIKSLFIAQANLVGSHLDQNCVMRDVIDQIPFIVTADLEMTDTARVSDIVLPVAHFYESADLVQVGATQPYIQYSEAAAEPPFECKSDADIVRLLAAKMGIDEYFNQSDEYYIRELLDTEINRANGITYESLLEQHAIRVFPTPWLPYGGKQLFNTPEHRMQIYVEKPQPFIDYGQEIPVERDHLPMFYEPTEAWPGTEAQKKYPLILISERPRYRVHSQFSEVKWLREIDPEPIIKVNPVDADARGLKNRDLVEVYNDRGHAVARLIMDDSLMPGLVKYPKGWQRHHHRAGSFSELNSIVSDPVGTNQSFFDATCDIRRWEGV